MGSRTRALSLEAMEQQFILVALALNGGNQTRTAQQLKIGSATLYRKLKSYGRIGAERSRQAIPGLPLDG